MTSYDLGRLRLLGRNFSICKVSLVKPNLSSPLLRDMVMITRVIYMKGMGLSWENLTSIMNRTRTSEVDEAQRYHFNPLQCHCRRPKWGKGSGGGRDRFGSGRQRGPSESRSEQHFRKGILSWLGSSAGRALSR